MIVAATIGRLQSRIAQSAGPSPLGAARRALILRAAA
jgi:hypothetical protein